MRTSIEITPSRFAIEPSFDLKLCRLRARTDQESPQPTVARTGRDRSRSEKILGSQPYDSKTNLEGFCAVGC